MTVPSPEVCCIHVFMVGLPSSTTQPSRLLVIGSAPGAGNLKTGVWLMSAPFSGLESPTKVYKIQDRPTLPDGIGQEHSARARSVHLISDLTVLCLAPALHVAAAAR